MPVGRTRRNGGPAVSGQHTGLTYGDAGVDIDAAASALSRVTSLLQSTISVEAGAGAPPIGHFGGVYRLPAGPDRVLVASADGVGTKLKLAFVLGGDAHARVGGDLVNHCVNDILALGARPLFFLDYVATGHLEPDVFELLVGGMARACQENELALIGGETAEMPGFYATGEYDVAGFIVGMVEPDAIVDGSRVQAGDRLIGLPSVGLHTNGYSLARRIVGLTGDGADRERLDQPLPDGGGLSIDEALMQPHLSYQSHLRPLLDRGIVRGLAHITGGGIVDNLPRMLPPGLSAQLDPTAWTVPPIFSFLVERGGVSPAERYRAFNMGIGFVIAVEPDTVDWALQQLRALPGVAPAVVIGEVVPDDGTGRAVRGLPGMDGAT